MVSRSRDPEVFLASSPQDVGMLLDGIQGAAATSPQWQMTPQCGWISPLGNRQDSLIVEHVEPASFSFANIPGREFYVVYKFWHASSPRSQHFFMASRLDLELVTRPHPKPGRCCLGISSIGRSGGRSLFVIV